MWCGLGISELMKMRYTTEIYMYHVSNKDLSRIKSPLDSLFEEEIKEMRRKIEYNGDTRNSYVLSKWTKSEFHGKIKND